MASLSPGEDLQGYFSYLQHTINERVSMQEGERGRSYPWLSSADKSLLVTCCARFPRGGWRWVGGCLARHRAAAAPVAFPPESQLNRRARQVTVPAKMRLTCPGKSFLVGNSPLFRVYKSESDGHLRECAVIQCFPSYFDFADP